MYGTLALLHFLFLCTGAIRITKEKAVNSRFECPMGSRHVEMWERHPEGHGFCRSGSCQEEVPKHLPDGCRAAEQKPSASNLIQLQEAVGSQDGERLPLIPYPAKVKFLDEEPAVVSQSTTVHADSGISSNDLSVLSIRQRIGNISATLKARRSLPTIELKLAPKAGENSEGYRLEIKKDSISLSASALPGLFYGAQTLSQLIQTSPELRACIIEDAPAFSWRGLHMDVSRHFFPAKDVMKLIDTMSMFKLNRFHWHLTDDQGWRLPVPEYPALTTLGSGPRFDHDRQVASSEGVEGHYTEDDIRRVVRYAKERHIEVIPEVDVPGHAASAVAAYPEIGNADFSPPKGPQNAWGVHHWTLSPTKAASRFLNAVFDSVTSLFPSKYIHVGGDEAPTDQWNGASFQTKQHWEPVSGHVQSFFNKKMNEILHAKGRSMAGWDEVQSMAGLSEDTLIFAWRSEDELRRAVMGNHFVVNANNGALYFDHYQGDQYSEPKAIGGFTSLQEVYSYNPVPNFVSESQRHLVLGAQCQLWTEYIKTFDHLEYMAFPRALALAERVWTPKESIVSFGEFKNRLGSRVQDLMHRKVNFRSLSKA